MGALFVAGMWRDLWYWGVCYFNIIGQIYASYHEFLFSTNPLATPNAGRIQALVGKILLIDGVILPFCSNDFYEKNING